MKKKQYGNTLKEQLKASAKDKLYHFLISDGKIRGAVVHGTKMINEMRSNFNLGILETLILGHAYLGVTLMSVNLKGKDQISMKIDCSGPVKGLSVEVNAQGEVRGFIKQNPIPVKKALTNLNLSSLFGAGFLSVSRHLEDAKHPFTGQVMLQYGNIAKDLANYYLTSEQIPSSFNLSIHFDEKGELAGAGPVAQAIRKSRMKTSVNIVKSLLNLIVIYRNFSLASISLSRKEAAQLQYILESDKNPLTVVRTALYILSWNRDKKG